MKYQSQILMPVIFVLLDQPTLKIPSCSKETLGLINSLEMYPFKGTRRGKLEFTVLDNFSCGISVILIFKCDIEAAFSMCAKCAY